MVGLDLRDREKKFKDGRHVGLDFYDLLIEAIKSYQQLLEWVLPPLVICPVGARCIIQV